jgi:hypothetical protein
VYINGLRVENVHGGQNGNYTDLDREDRREFESGANTIEVRVKRGAFKQSCQRHGEGYFGFSFLFEGDYAADLVLSEPKKEVKYVSFKQYHSVLGMFTVTNRGPSVALGGYLEISVYGQWVYGQALRKVEAPFGPCERRPSETHVDFVCPFHDFLPGDRASIQLYYRFSPQDQFDQVGTTFSYRLTSSDAPSWPDPKSENNDLVQVVTVFCSDHATHPDCPK